MDDYPDVVYDEHGNPVQLYDTPDGRIKEIREKNRSMYENYGRMLGDLPDPVIHQPKPFCQCGFQGMHHSHCPFPLYDGNDQAVLQKWYAGWVENKCLVGMLTRTELSYARWLVQDCGFTDTYLRILYAVWNTDPDLDEVAELANEAMED